MYRDEVNDKSNLDKGEPSLTRLKTYYNESTQTNYQDSETQTNYQVPCSSTINDCGLLSIFSTSKTGYASEPTNEVPVVKKIHNEDYVRDRNCLHQKLLSAGKQNLHTQITITKQIERIEWMMKVEKLDYINHARMELAQSLLYQRRVKVNNSITEREESYRALIETKNHKLHSLFQDKERQIRKLKNSRREK